MKTINYYHKSKLVIIGFLLLLMQPSCKDPDPTPDTPTEKQRYKDYIFSNVEKTPNVIYGNQGVSTSLDIFTPVGDSEQNRPLVLLSPGGVFSKYTRSESLEGMATNLAKRGYVAAVVKYSLMDNNSGINYTTLNNVLDLLFNAAEEQKAAVRFFNKEAETYGIDTENIFVGGWSTGSQIAFLNAYMNDESDLDEISDPTIKTYINERYVANGNSFEGNFGNEGYSSKIRGVLAIFIYVFEENIINSTDPGLMIISHRDEQLTTGELTADGFTYPLSDHNVVMSGSNQIYSFAQQVLSNTQITRIIKTNDVGGGTNNNVSTLSSDHYNQIADYFYSQLVTSN